jgi:hypothetical protein
LADPLEIVEPVWRMIDPMLPGLQHEVGVCVGPDASRRDERMKLI